MSLDNMQYHTPATRFTNRFCGSAVPSLNGCFFACSDSFRKIFCRKTAGNLVVTKNRILSLSLSLSLFFRAYYIYFLLNIKKLVEYFLLILRDFRYVRYYTNYMPPSTAKVRGRYCCVYRQAELHGIMSSACRYVFYPV